MTERPGTAGWSAYLATFHQERAGITEEILAAATSGGQNPYQWLLDALPAGGHVLDLACGSAPLLRWGFDGRWTGVDRSPRELDLAGGAAGARVVRAEAAYLPFADQRFSAAVCSMALMLLQPLGPCLEEVRRVLVPGGTVVALLPGGAGPLGAGDLWRWGRVLAALGRVRFEYPNPGVLSRAATDLNRHGWEIADDDRRRFGYQIADRRAAQRFVDSLYVPGARPARHAAAHRVAGRWAGAEIGIPLRRLVLRSRGG